MKKRLLYSLLLLFVCLAGSMRVWALEPDGDGVYQIGTAQDLIDFAAVVNGGEYNANAVLTADIVLADVWESPIGFITSNGEGATIGGNYSGIFDGQGHSITGFDAVCDFDGGGLFGRTDGATIKNFSIAGILSVAGGTGSGVIGYPANSTISNVHSTLTIDALGAGLHHVGGVVGSARGGNTISGCTFSGSLTVGVGSTDNFAGVVAYLGGDSVSYCANYGTITFSDEGCAAGGIAGYLNNTTSYIKGCLNMGKVIFDMLDGTPKWGGAIVGRLRNYDTAKLTGNCWLEGSAYGPGKDNDGKVNLTQAFCFAQDNLATGEVCYTLNGDQSVIGWYQTLNADEVPVLEATHAQVYKNGHKHCDGSWYEGYIYSNTFSEVVQDDHNMINGVCDYCGYIDEEAIANSMVLNDDGFYEIGNAPQLMWFARYVNDSHPDANAILTADIDLAKVVNSSNPWNPIGVNSYTGTFDGKGFTISNFNVTSNGDNYGMFGKLAGGAVVKGFVIEGTINSLNQYVGVVGSAGGGTVNISDIHSKVNINCSKSRHGGILGFQSSTGTININRCIYSGTMDAGNTGGNFGGIVGLAQNSSSAYINITDCLFDGTVLDGTGDNAGGIVGYANATKVTIKNCLSVGAVVAAHPSPFFGQVKGGNCKWAGKNYYTTEGNLVGVLAEGKTIGGTEPVMTSEEELASGEICWALNEEKFLDVAWRQTIDVDPYPMPIGRGDCVYLFSMGIENINSDNIAELIDNVSTDETDFIENDELVAYNVLINEYKEAIQSWETINNFNDFLVAYRASVELKENIKKSAANYERYIQTCENSSIYIEENNLEGIWTDFLKTYLEEDKEPNSDYPNGSYSYIIENRNLDDETLVAEIAFVNQMLEYAIAGGLLPGTEITRLLKNTDFTEGEDHFEGWITESEDGIAFATGGDTSTMRIARGLGKGTFNISQTLDELPNGVYMMAVNGMFRSGADVTNQFYAGQLYLNGTANYVMSPGEDVVLEEDAEPGVNCLGEGGDKLYELDDIVGWVPNGIAGCPVAYGAGRYQNFCATEVTDGTLTVGVRSLGTGLASDWLPFGNLHVYYLGTADEADEKLAGVLDAFAARAQIIVGYENNDGTNGLEEATQRPNISKKLKDQLTEAINGVAEATTGEKKMALINTFSALFAEVHTCRKTYVKMYEVAERLGKVLDNLLALGIIEEDEYGIWNDDIVDVYDHFAEGTVTTEEALAIIEKMSFIDQLMPQVDGVYQLSSAKQLLIFSSFVNGGQPNLKAVLTSDIDMSELDFFDPIGVSDKFPFTGEFDGQGHAIKNFVHEAIGNWNGLFGYINNATVKNFRISGTLTSVGYNYNGVVGQAEGTSVVSGVYSDMNINISEFKAHSGGIVGGCTSASKILVENCEYAGTMTHSGTGDCQAGILGYTYAGGVKNCIFSGTIIGENSKYGGILGYCKIPGFQGVQNCLSIGKIVAAEDCTTAAAIIANWNGGATSNVKNNYYCLQEGSTTTIAIGNKASSCEAPHAVTAAQLASGEICYKLNAGKQGEDIVWFQTLLEDATPVLDNTHLIVLYTDELGYHNEGSDPDAIKSVTPALPKVEGVIYNLAGQRMNRLQKGINIVGNKKVLY